MPDASDYFRGYARDIGVNPAINGANNVQDALAASGGGVTLGNYSTDFVQADASTALTADGASHDVRCLVAAPPAWMDDAGNITAAGLYNVLVNVINTAGPTTPGSWIRVNGALNTILWLPCDAVAMGVLSESNDVQSLADADVPYDARVTVVMPTDVTEAVSVRISIARLAIPA